MRIIAGRYGRRTLETPKDRAVRPTGDKIRGAVFNALESQGAVEGVCVLDAFCGTGALGLEALSRGASYCLFADKARASLDLARRNVQALDVQTCMCDFLLGDALSATFPGGPYGLVFLDPPYRKGFEEPVLCALQAQGVLADGAWIVIESAAADAPLEVVGFDLHLERVYGDTRIRILRYNIPV